MHQDVGGRPIDRESFRAWFDGYKREVHMTERATSFAASWWRELAPALRCFIVSEAGLKGDAASKAMRGEFAALVAVDQERLMLVARDVMRDLKPVMWMG